jgi:hypothetical protein
MATQTRTIMPPENGKQQASSVEREDWFLQVRRGPRY